MPLKRGYSRATVSSNVATLRREGKSAAQASAIALSSARKAWRSRHKSGPFPAHLRELTATRNPARHKTKSAITLIFPDGQRVKTRCRTIPCAKNRAINDSPVKGSIAGTRLEVDGQVIGVLDAMGAYLDDGGRPPRPAEYTLRNAAGRYFDGVFFMSSPDAAVRYRSKKRAVMVARKLADASRQAIEVVENGD